MAEQEQAVRDADVFDGDEFLRLLASYARAADDPMQTEADHYQALEAVRAFCRAQIAAVEERAKRLQERVDHLAVAEQRERFNRSDAEQKLHSAESLVTFQESTIENLQAQVQAAHNATSYEARRRERLERGIIAALSGLGYERG
jgi:chromosome segregation ATPase